MIQDPPQPHGPGPAQRSTDAATAPSGDRPRVALRSVALPVEHGGWGFLLEPGLLGLVLAPSLAGLGLVLAALGAFLMRHPLKLWLSDLGRGARYPRTAWAERFALLYGALALACLALAWSTAAHPFWLPLVLAAPLGLLQLAYDARNRGRDVVPELVGAMALGALATCVVLAGGWRRGPAFALWLIMAARAAASVLYIRSRLRLDRGLPPALAATWLAHGAALLLSSALALAGWSPWLGVAAFAALAGRAAQGLSGARRPVRPQVIGFREMGFGLLTVVLLALGYALRL